jgi:hypothetical protein
VPPKTFVLEGSVWTVSVLTCGYLATCAAPKLLVASETIGGLLDAACDALGISRVTLTEAVTRVEGEEPKC